MIKAKLSYG